MANRVSGAADGLAARLLADGVAVHDGYLPPVRSRALTACGELRRARGEFGPARVGADRRWRRREEIRGDLTCWFGDSLFEEERALLKDLDQLRLDLNRLGFLGLFDLELHYAWYPPGAGYARHMDQLQGRDQRMVSVIVYLNEAWEPGAGGELRLFGGGALDIEPVAGRLACFLTEGREHEVLPTARDRLSVSGWFRRRV